MCIVLKCILEKINDTLPWLNNSSLWKFQRILRRLEGEKMKICLTVLTDLLLCIFFNLQSLFRLAKVIFWGNLTNIIRWWQHISPNVLSAGTCFSQPIGLQPCLKDDYMKLPWSLLPAQLLCYIYAAWSCINFSLFFKCFWNFLNTIARSALGNLLLFSSKLCWSLQNHYSTLLFVQPTWHRVCNESLKKYSSSSVCVYVCACACVFL